METIEAVVYIVITMMLGTLLIGFLLSRDWAEEHRNLTRQFQQRDKETFSVTSDKLAETVSILWGQCGFGTLNETFAVYVEDSATIFKGDVIYELRRLDQCEVIDCYNERGQFEFPDTIDTPKIINIECENKTLRVQ